MFVLNVIRVFFHLLVIVSFLRVSVLYVIVYLIYFVFLFFWYLDCIHERYLGGESGKMNMFVFVCVFVCV